MIQKPQRPNVLVVDAWSLGLKSWRDFMEYEKKPNTNRRRDYVRKARRPKQRKCYTCGHRTVFLYDHGKGMYICSECEAE
jgi:hypothetical protein